MQVKTKLPKVLKVPLLTAALCASEKPTDSTTKQKDRPQPSDFRSTGTLLPSFSQTSTEEMDKEKVVTAPSSTGNPSALLDRESFEFHSQSQQNEEQFFVTQVI